MTAVTTDVLETVYKLKDQYTGPLRTLTHATDAFGAKVSGLMKAMMSPAGLLGAAVAGGGLVAMGGMAMRAAADLEQMRQTLIALTGSAEEADKKLKFAAELAIPSTYTARQLREATVTLEAFGLRAEKVLPLIAKLGGAFKADDEGLHTISRIFGELASGRMPDVEMLTRFGLNRRQFMEAGVQFDSQNRLMSTPKEALEALERIINAKYGDILDRMAGTTNAKLASLQDTWERVMVQIGTLLNTHIAPVLQKITDIIDKLEKSGTIKSWVEGLANGFKALGKMVGFVAGTLAFIFGSAMFLGVVKIVEGVMALGKTLASVFAWLTGINMLTKQWIPALLGALALVAGLAAATWFGFQMDQEFRRLMAELPVSMGSPPGVPEPGGPWSGDESKLDTPMNQTARNTARTAKATEEMAQKMDLRRIALGGGPMGEIGITRQEYYMKPHGAGGGAPLFTGRSTLEQAIADLVNQRLMEEAVRRGKYDS